MIAATNRPTPLCDRLCRQLIATAAEAAKIIADQPSTPPAATAQAEGGIATARFTVAGAKNPTHSAVASATCVASKTGLETLSDSCNSEFDDPSPTRALVFTRCHPSAANQTTATAPATIAFTCVTVIQAVAS